MDFDAVAKRIKQVRKQSGLTQVEFAGRLSVSQSYLSSIESGREEATGKLIKLVCHEFKISEEWLCNGIGEMHVEQRPPQLVLTNQALAKITDLLTTPSTERYNRYVNILYYLSTVMDAPGIYNEEQRLGYLDALEDVITYLHAYMQAHIGESGAAVPVSYADDADVTNALGELIHTIKSIQRQQQ